MMLTLLSECLAVFNFMNKLVINPQKPIPAQYKCGDLFTNRDIIYILCVLDGNYVAISLADGNYWDYKKPTISEAVDGLFFYGSDVKITFELTE